MRVAEEIIRTELECVAPVEDLVRFHEDFGLTFTVEGGHLTNYFGCDGITVLTDRQ